MKCEICKEEIYSACGEISPIQIVPCGSCDPEGKTKYYCEMCYFNRYRSVKDDEILKLRIQCEELRRMIKVIIHEVKE